jgi:hypothetical protein
MNNFPLQFLIYAAEGLFFLGGFVFAVRQIRKDLTGVAGIVRSESVKNEERYLATVVAALLLAPEEKKQFIAGAFLNAGKGKK